LLDCSTPLLQLHASLKDANWFLSKTVKRQDGTIALVALRLPTGESFCFNCGRTVEAWCHKERSEIIQSYRRDAKFRMDFSMASEILASDGPNPFLRREVRGFEECGLEIAYPAALVSQTELEKKFHFCLDGVKGINLISLPCSLGGLPLTGAVVDIDSIPAGLRWHEVKIYYKKKASLSEVFMQPDDQARDQQGHDTWQWLARRQTAADPQPLQYSNLTQRLPTCGSIEVVVKEAMTKGTQRDEAVKATMASLGWGTAAPREILQSGSRLSTFVSCSAGASHLREESAEEPKRGRASAKQAVKREFAPKKVTDVGSTPTKKRLKKEQEVGGDAGVVFAGIDNDVATGDKESKDSKDKDKDCSPPAKAPYQHKDISMKRSLWRERARVRRRHRPEP